MEILLAFMIKGIPLDIESLRWGFNGTEKIDSAEWGFDGTEKIDSPEWERQANWNTHLSDREKTL